MTFTIAGVDRRRSCRACPRLHDRAPALAGGRSDPGFRLLSSPRWP